MLYTSLTLEIHTSFRSLAASAPILQFPGLYDCGQYFEIVTKDFEGYSKACSESIKHSWSALRRIANTTEGLNWITKQFNLCVSLDESNFDDFMVWLSSAYENLAMTDYPNPASFLQPLPAYPIKVSKSIHMQPISLLTFF